MPDAELPRPVPFGFGPAKVSSSVGAAEPDADPPRPPELDSELVGEILDLLHRVLGPTLTSEVDELLLRAAGVSLLEGREAVVTFSASSLFVAAVLWGREEGDVPLQARNLARAVGGSRFNDVFLSGLLGDDYARRLVYPRPAPIVTKHAAPELADSIRSALSGIGPASSPSEPPAVEAILLRLFEPQVAGTSLNRRLATAGLDPAAMAAAIRGSFLTTSTTQFTDDRPQARADQLGRGALAVAIAHLMCRIYEAQQGVPEEAGDGDHAAANDAAAGRVSAGFAGLRRWIAQFWECERDSRDRAAFIMHIDAPWGGGKTTFANFVRAILTTGTEREQDKLAHELGVLVAAGDWPRVDLPQAEPAGRRLSWKAGRQEDRAKADGIWDRPYEAQRQGGPGEAGPNGQKADSEADRPANGLPWVGACFNAWRNEHVHHPGGISTFASGGSCSGSFPGGGGAGSG